MGKKAYAKAGRGFTLVELLIVIVIIAILATISVVAYNGIQERARDNIRSQDIKTITKALEMYYIDHGEFPNGSCSQSGQTCPDPKTTNHAWATTADGSWDVLESALVPEYISELPRDPVSEQGTRAVISGSLNYAYISYTDASTCGIGRDQTYRLYYRLESASPKTYTSGTCPDTNEGFSTSSYPGTSRYMVIKN